MPCTGRPIPRFAAAVVAWDNMRQNERNGFYQGQVKKFADRIVERPSREFYEVRAARGVRGGPELLGAAE